MSSKTVPAPGASCLDPRLLKRKRGESLEGTISRIDGKRRKIRTRIALTCHLSPVTVPMKSEQWQQIDSLVHSALEREPAERAAFLDEACAGDESLRQQVEVLLTAHEEAGSFIEKPAFAVEAQSLADDQDDSPVGQTIGHYKIISIANFTHDTDRVRRFQQEARAASALNHPNIIVIHEVGQIDGRAFIASEYIDGETLRQYLTGPVAPAGGTGGHQSGTSLKLRDILNIGIQTADALAAAHEAGIVHRDIKPENIMLRRRDGYVKVLDFGLAKLTEISPVNDLEGQPKLN